MLRGSSRTLEQTTDARGAVAQFHVMRDVVPAPPGDRHLAAQTRADATQVRGGGAGGGEDPALVLAAAQLYPFATEQAGGAEGGDGAGLPLDPLDPTWGRASDRDRALSAAMTTKALAADFDVLPVRLLQSDAREGELQAPPVPAVLAGLLVFALAGVAVNRARRRLAKKQKAFDDDDDSGASAAALLDGGDCDSDHGRDSTAYSYALFS